MDMESQAAAQHCSLVPPPVGPKSSPIRTQEELLEKDGGCGRSAVGVMGLGIMITHEA